MSHPIVKYLKYNSLISFLARQYYKRLNINRLENIIFIATTGRSGTKTLVDIMNVIPHCKAEHEPYPAMFDDALKAKSYGNEKYVRDLYWHIKSINLWRSVSGFRHYLESNHMFIKTYIEYAVQDFKHKAIVIHLIRDPIKVANSIYALQDFPGTEEGNKWWLDYKANNNFIKIANYLDNDPEFKHPFYKGLWYWYEIEERIKYWRKKLPHVRFLDFYTEDFNDRNKTFKLLCDLNIEFDEKALTECINTRSNTRPHQKQSEPLSEIKATQMHNEFIKLLKKLNYTL